MSLKMLKRIMIGIAAFVLVIMIAFLVVVDLRFAAVRAAPRITHEEAVNVKPAVRAVFYPELMGDKINEVIAAGLGVSVPDWIMKRILPREIAVIFSTNHDTGHVDTTVFVNEQRLGPVLESFGSQLQIDKMFSEINWKTGGPVWKERGQMLMEGAFPMDASAREDTWEVWGQGLPLTPVSLEGGHLLECIADNRDGEAYLVFASLLAAYNIVLREEEEQISITSFQFVENAHLIVDLRPDGGASLKLKLTIQPEKRKRLAVANLKAFLDRTLETWMESARETHSLESTGGGEWIENVIVYTYEFDNALDILEAFLAESGLMG